MLGKYSIADAEKWLLSLAERALGKVGTPLALKEAAWRLIRWMVRKGKSNPISFALRPLVMSKRLRVAVGVNLAVGMVISAVVGPVPTMADNVGGQVSVVTGGEVSLRTPSAIQLPLKTYRLSQGFWILHPGLDMAAGLGEPINPVMEGWVVKVEKNWFGYGNLVVVSHGNDFESWYAHLSKILVTEGERVTMDSVLGLVGSTGRSTGPHLHIEIHENGRQINPAGILGLGGESK